MKHQTGHAPGWSSRKEFAGRLAQPWNISQALTADDGLIAQALGLLDYDAPRRDPIYRGKRAMPRRRTSGRSA